MAVTAAGAGWILGDRVAPAEAAPAEAGGAGSGDAVQLHSALAVELLLVFAYQHLLAAGTLGPGPGALAGTMAQHERAHVDRLTAELQRLGQSPPPPPGSVAEVDRQLSARHASGRLAAVHTELDGLRLLYDIESIAIGTYYEALAKLTASRLMLIMAEIMGAEAQHATAIGGVLHPGKWERVVPVASVQGKH